MEIERKFLVRGQDYRTLALASYIAQGYLNSDKNRTVRVRIDNDCAYLTVKSVTVGITRSEYEYAIPLPDAKHMIENLCEKPAIEKHRYRISIENKIWEVDEFLGENEGLVIAEIELESESEHFHKPSWIGAEISNDPRYYNANLVKNPYKNWK